nr:protein GLUTAMINE DUMPER 6-like [Ipomoea batatas]
MAEVLACREAVSWLKRHGIMEAQVESDCSGAINSLSRRTLDLSYVWHIVNHCYSLSPKGSAATGRTSTLAQPPADAPPPPLLLRRSCTAPRNSTEPRPPFANAAPHGHRLPTQPPLALPATAQLPLAATAPAQPPHGDSITEQSFRSGGWGAALADNYSRKASQVRRGNSNQSIWNSPVPYLFGCLAAILVLIFVALFVLAWAHCKKLHSSSSAGAGAEVQETPAAATGTMSIENDEEESITTMQPKMLVIMAGNDEPTCIATPISLISVTNQ